VWNFEDEGWCDRFFEVIMLRSLLCEILEMRVEAISFYGDYVEIVVVWNLEDDG